MKVSIKNLAMVYQDGQRKIPVINNLNFDIDSGDSVAILGQSGVGKSTLLNIIAGLEIPTSGEIYLGDTCISDALRKGSDFSSFRGKNIGFIFQFYQLLPEFDAVENVLMPLLIQGESYSSAKKSAVELLERVGLSQRLEHRPGMLSGGEQQRVAIARALIASPGILLADEPTGNLDSETGQSVSNLILELQKEMKITLIAVTHSTEFASRLSKQLRLTSEGLI